MDLRAGFQTKVNPREIFKDRGSDVLAKWRQLPA